MIIVSIHGTIDLRNQDQAARLESLNALFKALYDQLEIVQEVIIDGVAYRENYNNYLLENLMNIKSIEIKTVHEAIIVNDIKADLKDYLPKLIKACDSISELFYGVMKDEDWNHFGQLTEGMQWVGQSVHVLLENAKRMEGIPTIILTRFVSEVEGQIEDLEAGLQQNDYSRAGDIIKYELPDTFKALLNHLEAEVYS
ncbi:hypothetical protein [Cohnella herbarum]|uniref:Uncharacterized protein n=1 Tax=Cohnella herbarum TaxID=2728023 RepID=A0A7Z2VLG3_9BACL|nr:hypothetical protein [Cohnella herbarum]QJD85224.1 hypothetical protein HH215_19965 [Cohnella herbarum]